MFNKPSLIIYQIINMPSNLENRIIKHFQLMKIEINLQALTEYSNSEKEKLERLAERMLYLYNKIKYEFEPTLYLKKEFQALEWVFYEFNIIADGTPRTKF